MSAHLFASLERTAPRLTASTLGECLAWWARQQPDTCFASFWNGDSQRIASYTYAEFEARTRHLAWSFRASMRIAAGSRVLLAYPPGLELIAAFMGCVRAGIIPVPVCPPMPPHAASHLHTLLAIAKDCGAAALLTTAAGRVWRDSRAAVAVHQDWSGLPWLTTDDLHETAPADYADVGICETDGILFLQYTSGSTRTPRGVIVTHDTVIRNGLATLDHQPIGVSWLPQYHDMGLIGYALYPMITGGTTHTFSPIDFLRRPALWFELITRVGATCTSSPNFGLEYCLRPGKIDAEDLRACDLGSLRFLMNAAEPVSPDTHRRFFERFVRYGLRREAHMVAYGLAENTLCVTSGGTRTLRLERDGPEVVSCGRPVDGVDVRIVAPDTSLPLGERQVGEVWVAGSSACRGYWANSDLTAATFHNTLALESRPQQAQQPDRSEVGFIRTGDLGFVDRGELFVCGRMDDVIIRRGRNHHPHDIERTVEATSTKVRFGAVVAIAGREEGSLVVIAETRRIGDPPDCGELARVIAAANGIVPDRVIAAAPGAIEKTTSGKLARRPTRRKYLAGEITFLAEWRHADQSSEATAEGRAERRARIAMTLASCGSMAGGDDRPLGDVGLDSLTLVTLILDLEQLLIETTGRGNREFDGSLVQACTLAQLRDLIAACESCESGESSPEHVWMAVEAMAAAVRATHDESVRDRMRHDARLGVWPSSEAQSSSAAASASASASAVVGTRLDTDAQVLLTGATGFFGPFLLHSLLEQTTCSYHILIRARDRAAGLDKLRASMRQARLWTPEIDDQLTRRITIVPGDLAAPGLGLRADDWNALASRAGMVIHNGAAVNYVASYDALRGTNVEGTRSLLRLASEHHVKEFHFISSTVIFGWTPAPEVRETDRNAGMSNLDFGYAQSKWVAEQLVLEARREGARTFVYRPSFISASTAGIASRDDIVIRLLAFMIDKGIAVNARNQVSFLPADVVAHNVAAIIRGPRRAAAAAAATAESAETVHVTADEYYNLMDVTRILSRNYGYEFEYFDIPDFVAELRRRCTPEDAMYPLLDFFTRSRDKMAAMQHKRYSNVHYRRAREHTGAARPEPSLDATIDCLHAAMLSAGAITRPRQVR